MKTKTSNKLNIVLLAITLLLLFVIGVGSFGKTNSWLIDKYEIGFEITVQPINIVVKQGLGNDAREISNTGYVYLGTDIIESDKPYNLNITITNNETGVGYYIRCQAFAVANGVTYNINNCITGDFYNRADGWMYSVDDENNNTPMAKSGEQGSVLTVIQNVKFPQSFINAIQGQYVKLHLFIEGSATGIFGEAIDETEEDENVENPGEEPTI